MSGDDQHLQADQGRGRGLGNRHRDSAQLADQVSRREWWHRDGADRLRTRSSEGARAGSPGTQGRGPIPKKSGSLLRQGAAVVSRYEFIDSQKVEPHNRNPVVKMCYWLDVSTSGFYHWLTRPQSATAARREALLARIRHYFEESEGTYGYRRIHADLTAEQTQCSPELVRQIMHQEGLVACQPRPFRVTREANALAGANMPDLLTRDFTAERSG